MDLVSPLHPGASMLWLHRGHGKWCYNLKDPKPLK